MHGWRACGGPAAPALTVARGCPYTLRSPLGRDRLAPSPPFVPRPAAPPSPRRRSWNSFIPAFTAYFLYQGIVQVFQASYQKKRHYALLATGKAKPMDVSQTGASVGWGGAAQCRSWG